MPLLLAAQHTCRGATTAQGLNERIHVPHSRHEQKVAAAQVRQARPTTALLVCHSGIVPRPHPVHLQPQKVLRMKGREETQTRQIFSTHTGGSAANGTLAVVHLGVQQAHGRPECALIVHRLLSSPIILLLEPASGMHRHESNDQSNGSRCGAGGRLPADAAGRHTSRGAPRRTG